VKYLGSVWDNGNQCQMEAKIGNYHENNTFDTSTPYTYVRVFTNKNMGIQSLFMTGEPLKVE